jgi:hypothetical protein
MTTPGMQGEVSPESMGKTAFSAAEGSSDAKSTPTRTTGKTVEQHRLNPCRGKPFDLCRELKLESQNGNPGLGVFSGNRSSE